MTISIILGTRPEIIKLSPIIRYLTKNKIPYTLIHTGQHYSYELSDQIFEDLYLKEPDYNLHVGSCPQGEQTGKMLIGIEPILQKEKPCALITLGDPNSAFAGSLAAAKLHIPVCHIEAGRRSGNRHMSEELNRLMIDQISDLLFTPNETTKQNLLNAGISPERIILSGDPIVDAVSENKDIAKEKSNILDTLNLSPGKYFLATLHRPENIDRIERLESIISAFRILAKKYEYKFIFPVHPKTRGLIEKYSISTDDLILTKPLGYLDFLRLETDSAAVLTDSGSLQEEDCILKVPCITLRDDTERPETLAICANILVGADTESIISGTEEMLQRPRDWINPFGEEGTSEHIIDEILTKYNK